MLSVCNVKSSQRHRGQWTSIPCPGCNTEAWTALLLNYFTTQPSIEGKPRDRTEQCRQKAREKQGRASNPGGQGCCSLWLCFQGKDKHVISVPISKKHWGWNTTGRLCFCVPEGSSVREIKRLAEPQESGLGAKWWAKSQASQTGREITNKVQGKTRKT